MGHKPTISVIIPVYNVEDYLARCVDSILVQTYEKLDVILVDDGSPDGSGKICDEYAAKDSRVRVIHKPNGGLSSARNAGLDAAAGEYLSFIDSDDWIEPDTYEHMMGLLDKYQAQIVSFGNIEVDGATGEQTLGICPKKEECISSEEMVGRIFLWDGCDSSVCDKVFHASLFENFRFPEGKLSEDVAITYKIILQTSKVVMCERPVYYYYQHPNSITKQTVITEKTFHYSQHTEKIYRDIRENHPAILPQVTYLRVKALSHILLLLEQSEAEVRQIFAQQYRYARKALGAFFGFILTTPWLGAKERITDILLILGIYRQLRPIFHR